MSQTPIIRGHDQKGIEELGRDPYLKYNISSSNQAITINEVPLDSKGFFA